MISYLFKEQILFLLIHDLIIGVFANLLNSLYATDGALGGMG